MKRIFLISLLLVASTMHAKVGDNLFIGASEQKITVHNRVLVNINGKPISVMDVMKKMDVLFYRQFPEYTESTEARYQFYKVNWKKALEDLIDKELILADATENKMPISNGDVRQELENLFGPNILANLEKISLPYEQAFEMIKGDILLRRMLYFRVNMKAMRQVTPLAIKQKYDLISKEDIRPSKWTYQVISIRNPNPTVGAEAAKKTHELLGSEVTLGQLTVERVGVNEGTRINISEEFTQNEIEVNPAHLEILKTLGVGSFSEPIKQQSRSDNATVFRIFYLKDKKEGGVVSFHEVEKQIKDMLTNEAIDKESDAYISKLRHYYGISETNLADFEPFTLN